MHRAPLCRFFLEFAPPVFKVRRQHSGTPVYFCLYKTSIYIGKILKMDCHKLVSGADSVVDLLLARRAVASAF